MRKGENRATQEFKIKWIIKSTFSRILETEKTIETSPCVFLSHKNEDKAARIKIAKYLEDAGIDFYLDIYDNNLQYSANENDPIKITNHLKNGILLSSHMIVVISEKTIESQWVPFEIGYGHTSIVDKNLISEEESIIVNLAFLALKDINTLTIPDFLKIATPIRDISSLNDYLDKIKPREAELIKHFEYEHPLDGIMKRQ